MIRAVQAYARDPLPLATLGVAAILAETIIRTTGSGVGVGAIFLLSIIYISEERGLQCGIISATFFAVFNNYSVIQPRYSLDLPSLNEFVLYGAGYAAAFVGGRIGVRKAEGPYQSPAEIVRTAKLRRAVGRIERVDLDYTASDADHVATQSEFSAVCAGLVRDAREFERLQEIKPLMLALDHLDRESPDGLCHDTDASQLVRAAVAAVKRLT